MADLSVSNPSPLSAAHMRQNVWWTCAELNCGLTRFIRGSYTLSLWSDLALGQSADILHLGHTSEIHRGGGEVRIPATFPTE